MKLTTISHPLKTIRLTYMSEAPLSEFESNFITQYQLMHDGVLKMKQKILQLRSDIADKEQAIKKPQAGYYQLKEETNLCERYLGLTGDESDEATEYSISPHLFQLKLDDYKTVIDEYWEGTDTLYARYKEIFDVVKDFDNLFAAFEKQFEKPFFKNYENMEIDILSVDADLNAFKDKWTEVYTLFETTVDEYDAWLKEHHKLYDNINTLYARIKKIFGWVADMQKYNKGEEGSSFSVN